MPFQIALIGMSGVGKSHWSGLLERRGFRRYFCDGLIEERLGPLLARADGVKLQMGEWMGFPYEPGYPEREAIYLAHEIEVMKQVLDQVAEAREDGGAPLVIDTTGSVIYTGRAVLERLAELTRIIYLDAPSTVQRAMQEAYKADPAPVLWRDQFAKKPGESDQDALARCYPALLASRSRAYRRLAHVTLDYHQLRSRGFDTDDFIESISH